ncbi:MAG: multicopper oxidase domain-containing protein [Cyanobacteria bacterium P01_H01_bin.26]
MRRKQAVSQIKWKDSFLMCRHDWVLLIFLCFFTASMKHNPFFDLLFIGIFCLLLASPARADNGLLEDYEHQLTAPSQIKSENGKLEAAISIDYNITNNEGYIPSNSSTGARFSIGPDVVSLRNYTVQHVQQGSFTATTADGDVAKTPNGNSSTWFTDLIGPTLRAKPGDTITLHLSNNLPDDRYVGYEQAKSNPTFQSRYQTALKSNPTLSEKQFYYDEGYTSCIDPRTTFSSTLDQDQQGMLSNATCNMTNFHTHGLHDSPANTVKQTGEIASTTGTDKTYNSDSDYWISDDVIDSLIPGNQWDIQIEIPDKHPAGTFWYHPHQHGATSVALGSGLEGAIIIDDLAATQSNFNPDTPSSKVVPSLDAILKDDLGITKDQDRLLMFQHLPYESPTEAYGAYNCTRNTPCEVGWTYIVEKNGTTTPENSANFVGSVFTGYTLVNGQPYPEIEMTAGEVERWRLVNGGVAEPVSLSIVQLSEAGIDSLPAQLDTLVKPNRFPFTDTRIGQGSVLQTWLTTSANFIIGNNVPETLPLNIIAYDGITTGKIDEPACPKDNSQNGYVYYQNCLTLGPGNRADALINPTKAGIYLLLKNVNYAYMSSAYTGEKSAEDIVAILSVTGDEAKPALPDPAVESALIAYAEQQYYPPSPNIAHAKPDHSYEGHFVFFPIPGDNKAPVPNNPDETKFKTVSFGMSFSCVSNSDPLAPACQAIDYVPNPSNLDKEMFTENMQPISLNLNEVGEWTFKVEFDSKFPVKGGKTVPVTSAHPFHIHTNPFYIEEIQTYDSSDGSGKDSGYSPYPGSTVPVVTHPNRWQDTLLVQPNQIVKFLYQPTDYEGSFVFHCHFVDHEDQGMMRWVKVCDANNSTCTGDNTFGLLPDFTKENF